MLEIAQALYLTDILHAVSQGLLAPVIIVLLAFIVYAVFLIGSIGTVPMYDAIGYLEKALIS